MLQEQVVVVGTVARLVVGVVLVDKLFGVDAWCLKAKAECHTICNRTEIGNVGSLKCSILLGCSLLYVGLYAVVDIVLCLVCEVVVEDSHVTVEVGAAFEEECHLRCVAYCYSVRSCAYCSTIVGCHMYTCCIFNSLHSSCERCCAIAV